MLWRWQPVRWIPASFWLSPAPGPGLLRRSVRISFAFDRDSEDSLGLAEQQLALIVAVQVAPKQSGSKSLGRREALAGKESLSTRKRMAGSDRHAIDGQDAESIWPQQTLAAAVL